MNTAQFNSRRDIRPGAFETIHGDWQPTIAVLTEHHRPHYVAFRLGARGMHRRQTQWEALRAACKAARELRIAVDG